MASTEVEWKECFDLYDKDISWARLAQLQRVAVFDCHWHVKRILMARSRPSVSGNLGDVWEMCGTCVGHVSEMWEPDLCCVGGMRSNVRCARQQS